MGSPFSFTARIARLRWLYRKQYFTPTMIHKLVKTTPNPSATKNSRGELPGVLLLLPESVWVGDAAAADVLVASAMVK